MSKRTITNWGLGILACAVFLSAQLLDQRDEEQATADAARDVEALAEMPAAQALCEAELGPGTRVLWTTDGDLVCRPAQVFAEGAAR